MGTCKHALGGWCDDAACITNGCKCAPTSKERFNWVVSIDSVCVLLRHSRDEDLPPTIEAINELKRIAGQIESSTEGTSIIPAVDYKALFESAVRSLAEISAALGIPEEAASTANGNEEIMAVLEELIHRVKTELPTLPVETSGDDLSFTFPKAWAPYLRAVIIGSLNDFEENGDCRWHLNELQKRLEQPTTNQDGQQTPAPSGHAGLGTTGQSPSAVRSSVETKELSPSEAASFAKTLARSPRRVETSAIPARPYPGDEAAVRQSGTQLPHCTCVGRVSDAPHRDNCKFWAGILAARKSWMDLNVVAWSCSGEAAGRKVCAQWCGHPDLCMATGSERRTIDLGPSLTPQEIADDDGAGQEHQNGKEEHGNY